MRIDKVINQLESLRNTYGNNIDVKLGMRQKYGTDFAMELAEIDVHKIKAFYGNDFKAIVITEGGQIGAVDYFDDDDEWEDDE